MFLFFEENITQNNSFVLPTQAIGFAQFTI